MNFWIQIKHYLQGTVQLCQFSVSNLEIAVFESSEGFFLFTK